MDIAGRAEYAETESGAATSTVLSTEVGLATATAKTQANTNCNV